MGVPKGKAQGKKGGPCIEFPDSNFIFHIKEKHHIAATVSKPCAIGGVDFTSTMPFNMEQIREDLDTASARWRFLIFYIILY